MIVSDHGMTESGNHGGSSFEETDSLAVFVGLGGHTLDYASATSNSANQVPYQFPQFIFSMGSRTFFLVGQPVVMKPELDRNLLQMVITKRKFL